MNMENKIPTAKEQIKEFKNGFDGLVFQHEAEISITEFLMIEFAKLHVEMALKEASDTKISGVYSETKYKRGDNDKDSILNAYPLTNIK